MPWERAFAVPRNVPATIRERLENAGAAVLCDPDFLKTSTSYASIISYLPGAEWQRASDANYPALQALARKMPPQP